MLAAALGGLDAFVFTAGIGENSAVIRAAIAARLGWMGAVLDEKANAAHASRIGARQPCCALRYSDRRGIDDRAPYIGGFDGRHPWDAVIVATQRRLRLILLTAAAIL
jgi:hypothetical protein